MVATADAKRHAGRVLRRLKAAYPDVHCALVFRTPLELLVATILSAQCTDTRVNIVTKELFRKYTSAAAFAAAPLADLERAIQSTGFFRMKAKSIKSACADVVEKHGGQVPRDLESLVALRGVGRKTANVVLNSAFGEAVMAVDTHIFRVSNRTGLAPGKNPAQVEMQLMRRVPPEYLVDAHHWLILHGRYVCQARTPLCWQCAVQAYCDYQPKTERKSARA